MCCQEEEEEGGGGGGGGGSTCMTLILSLYWYDVKLDERERDDREREVKY